MAKVTYDQAFFEANLPVALSAAEAVLPRVLTDTGVRSVIDIGCGQGAWLSVAKQFGMTVHGIDGYADPHLLLDEGEFTLKDISDGEVDCVGFGLAMCLEVAEHLPAAAADRLVAGLCQADYVLFSPAHPGQGGVNHINEQWASFYWAPKFAQHGYFGSSDIKWMVWDDLRVAEFYRENLLVFTSVEGLLTTGYSEGVVDVIHPENWEHGRPTPPMNCGHDGGPSWVQQQRDRQL